MRETHYLLITIALLLIARFWQHEEAHAPYGRSPVARSAKWAALVIGVLVSLTAGTTT